MEVKENGKPPNSSWALASCDSSSGFARREACADVHGIGFGFNRSSLQAPGWQPDKPEKNQAAAADQENKKMG